MSTFVLSAAMVTDEARRSLPTPRRPPAPAGGGQADDPTFGSTSRAHPPPSHLPPRAPQREDHHHGYADPTRPNGPRTRRGRHRARALGAHQPAPPRRRPHRDVPRPRPRGG